MNLKDINNVLENHDQALLSIPGVVGVYVGLRPDGKTQCLKVMVVNDTEDIKKKIPKSVEGFPVVVEVSGVIQPLENPLQDND